MRKIIFVIYFLFLSACVSTDPIGSRSVAEVASQTGNTQENLEKQSNNRDGVFEFWSCEKLDEPPNKFGIFRNYKRISDERELESIGLGILYKTETDCGKALRKLILEEVRSCSANKK